jgi:hypothetical protein
MKRVKTPILLGKRLLGGFLICFGLLTTGAQPISTAIRVISPQDGETFEPGASVQVMVEPEGPIPLQEVVVITKGSSTKAISAPFHLTFRTPQDLGPHKLGVFAGDQRQTKFLKEITYHVETTTPVTTIGISPDKVFFSRSRQRQLFVKGTFTDGKSWSITKSRETTYVSSNPEVATVTADGLVKAVGEGTATISVTYKGKSATVPVKVEFQRQSIKIDIRPGDPNNRINLDSQGVVPVAILTTNTFDAARVDPLSVRFGPNEAAAEGGRGHFEDVDGDGFSDMVLHFRQPETGIACHQTLATLTGSTIDGVLIKGTDFIRPRGNNCIELPRR